MNKCGKSFLPKCEYFTTGGCVSPFNCPYKIEQENIITTTQFNLYASETDKDAEIARLTAENAELKARLEKAVELPTIYEQTIYPFIESLYTETIYYVIYKENGRIVTINCGKNKSTAEARLAELNGGEEKMERKYGD